MKARIKISDIVGAFDAQGDMALSYVNVGNGQVVTISEEYIDCAHIDLEDESLPEWLRNEYALGNDVVESDDFIALPSQYDIHEYTIMLGFADAQSDSVIRGKLVASLRGKGAYRRFKDTAIESGVIEHWYVHRERAIAAIAIDWCRENDIEADEDLS